MLNFEQYIARHGEVGVQALVERLERYENVRRYVYAPLEDRWNALMKIDQEEQRMAA